MSIVDGEQLFFKTRFGTEPAKRPHELSFCAYAVMDPEHVMIVEDVCQDERFATNPNVVGNPEIRF